MIQDGAILIRDGILVEVGPSRRVENLAEARSAIEINAAGRVVMPGFVDAHTHLAFPPAGIDAPDMAAAARALHTVTGQRLEVRARALLEAMARHGTTTVEVKTGCGLDEGAECKLLRVLCALRREPIDLIPSFLFRLPGGLNGGSWHATEWVVSELLPKIRRRGVARFADIAWDSDSALLPCFDHYLAAARQLGFGRKIHADGASPAAAIALAALHRVASIDHLEHATAGEARQIAEAGIMATLLPSASFSGDAREAPARALIDAGVAVALGSNFNPHHTPALNMQAVVALACGRLGMSIEEAISAATINGAHALGCAEKVGSLEPGKAADLVILNAGHYRDLEHSLGTNLVHFTMKRGKFIYKEGDVAPLPADDLL
ncbi:MAG: amidohydrolase family protein [Candidatus Solibacter sp.]